MAALPSPLPLSPRDCGARRRSPQTIPSRRPRTRPRQKTPSQSSGGLIRAYYRGESLEVLSRGGKRFQPWRGRGRDRPTQQLQQLPPKGWPRRTCQPARPRIPQRIRVVGSTGAPWKREGGLKRPLARPAASEARSAPLPMEQTGSATKSGDPQAGAPHHRSPKTESSAKALAKHRRS